MPLTVAGSTRHSACAVIAEAMLVRPWYAWRSAMISVRPVWSRAAARAVSIASVPLFRKKVRERSPGEMVASARAASTWRSLT